METCIIFCAGEFDRLIGPIEDGDLVIAADGGLRHTRHLGIEPDVVLGDFDSLGYVPEGAVVHPVEKDDTDAMLAVRQGLTRGYRNFVIYGGMDGPRLDHTIANLQTLCFLAQQGARGHLVGLSFAATVIKDEKIAFSPDCGGIFSVFCLGNDALILVHGLSGCPFRCPANFCRKFYQFFKKELVFFNVSSFLNHKKRKL